MMGEDMPKLENDGVKSNVGQNILEQQILGMLQDGTAIVGLLKKIMGEVVEEKLKIQSESGGVLKKLFSGSSANEWKVKYESKRKEYDDKCVELESQKTLYEGRIIKLEKEKGAAIEERYKQYEREKKDLTTQFKKERENLEGEKKLSEQKAKNLEKTVRAQGEMLEQRFSKGWDAFETYKGLPQNVKDQFRVTFCDEDDFEAFILGGAKGNVIESLWDETKNNLGEECFSNLYKILECFVFLVNKVRNGSRYELVAAEVGISYDCREHQCNGAKKSQGEIRECILPGLYKNGKIVRMSVVELQ